MIDAGDRVRVTHADYVDEREFVGASGVVTWAIAPEERDHPVCDIVEVSFDDGRLGYFTVQQLEEDEE